MVTTSIHRQSSESHHLTTNYNVFVTKSPSLDWNRSPVREVIRRNSSRKATCKYRKRCNSPYGLRRQSSVPVTSRDRTTFHLCRQQMSTEEIMALRNVSSERPSCSTVSNKADPIVKAQSPNVIDLKAALEAVSAVATATAVVTRIPLQNSLATNAGISTNNATSVSNNDNSFVVTENQENEEIITGNEIENEEYLRQLHRYGVLLRIMGDKLDAEYGARCYELEQADHQVITQKPMR